MAPQYFTFPSEMESAAISKVGIDPHKPLVTSSNLVAATISSISILCNKQMDFYFELLS